MVCGHAYEHTWINNRGIRDICCKECRPPWVKHDKTCFLCYGKVRSYLSLLIVLLTLFIFIIEVEFIILNIVHNIYRTDYIFLSILIADLIIYYCASNVYNSLV